MKVLLAVWALFLINVVLVSASMQETDRLSLQQDGDDDDDGEMPIYKLLNGRIQNEDDDDKMFTILAKLAAEDADDDDDDKAHLSIASRDDADALAAEMYQKLKNELTKSQAKLKSFTRTVDAVLESFPERVSAQGGWWKRAWRKVKRIGRAVLPHVIRYFHRG